MDFARSYVGVLVWAACVAWAAVDATFPTVASTLELTSCTAADVAAGASATGAGGVAAVAAGGAATVGGGGETLSAIGWTAADEVVVAAATAGCVAVAAIEPAGALGSSARATSAKAAAQATAPAKTAERIKQRVARACIRVLVPDLKVGNTAESALAGTEKTQFAGRRHLYPPPPRPM
jgi:hypothetical protein